MAFKLEEICEEISRIQIPLSPHELEAIGVHIEEAPSADEAEGYREGYIRDVRSCLGGRRRYDRRGTLLRTAATDVILRQDATLAYLAWQFTDGWREHQEERYADRHEQIGESPLPLEERDTFSEGFVGPGDMLEYDLPNWEVVQEVRERRAEDRKKEVAEYHEFLKELALEFRRYAPEVLAFLKDKKEDLLQLLWETDDYRKGALLRPDLPEVRIEEKDRIERTLNEVVVRASVRAAKGDPADARIRMDKALRLLCSGGKASNGKDVKGFGLDPQVLCQVVDLGGRLKSALEEYRLRKELWATALRMLTLVGKTAARQTFHPDRSATFAAKVVAGVVHAFPRKWKEEWTKDQAGGQSKVIFHPADWDESGAKGSVQVRWKCLVPWAYLLGGFTMPADAVRFLADPETRDRLGLLGPNWIEETKRIVFGAYKRARQN